MNVLFLGDSITDCDHNFTKDNLGYGYVKKLSLLPDVTATNGGTDGFTFPNVLRKWRLMYARNTYDRVVITCGINDVGVIADLEASGRHEDASVFLEDSMAALQTLLYELIDADCAQMSSAYVQTPNTSSLPSDPSSHLSRILILEPFLFPVPWARALWLPVLLDVRRSIRKRVDDFNEGQVSLPKATRHSVAAAPRARYVPTQATLDDLASRRYHRRNPSDRQGARIPRKTGGRCARAEIILLN